MSSLIMTQQRDAFMSRSSKNYCHNLVVQSIPQHMRVKCSEKYCNVLDRTYIPEETLRRYVDPINHQLRCVPDRNSPVKIEELRSAPEDAVATWRAHFNQYPVDEWIEQTPEIKVILSQAYDPTEFYVILASKFADLEHLMNDLQKAYRKADASYVPTDGFFHTGCMIVALYEEEWHRAEVTNVYADSVRVILVDYGTRCQVKKSDTRYLIKRYANQPKAAIGCSLCGALPPRGKQDYLGKFRDRFTYLCDKRHLQCEIVQHEARTKRLIVIVTDLNSGMNVAEQLETEGLIEMSPWNLVTPYLNDEDFLSDENGDSDEVEEQQRVPGPKFVAIGVPRSDKHGYGLFMQQPGSSGKLSSSAPQNHLNLNPCAHEFIPGEFHNNPPAPTISTSFTKAVSTHMRVPGSGFKPISGGRHPTRHASGGSTDGGGVFKLSLRNYNRQRSHSASEPEVPPPTFAMPQLDIKAAEKAQEARKKKLGSSERIAEYQGEIEAAKVEKKKILSEMKAKMAAGEEMGTCVEELSRVEKNVQRITRLLDFEQLGR